MRAICLDRATGRLVQNVELFQKDKPDTTHAKNSHATPTAVLSGNRVFVHFGSTGTACLSTDGKVIWKNTSLQYHQPYCGAKPDRFLG